MNAITQSYTSQEQKVLDVFHRHVAAFTSGDLEAVLNDFDERSVVITLDSAFAGRERSRVLYQSLPAEFSFIDRGDSPSLTLDVTHM